jgi:serine/threonine-protein kinase
MSQKRANRRLAAILAADVVGYSRMMGADEYGTLKAVKRLRTSVIEPLLTRFDGRLIKTTGDGFLFEFGSVFDAFDFAAAIQGGTPNEEALQLRMGLNVGDIIFDDGDVFGDGVNVASRLEPLSPAGGLLISNRAWEDLRRLQLAFEDAGEIELKNIKESLRAWSLQNEQLREYSHALEVDRDEPAPRGEDIRSRADPLHLRSRRAVLAGGAVATVALAGVGGWVLLRPDAAEANSIAVLPFANLSGDPAQAYFSDGIAEELRSALSRIAGLKVVARTSSEMLRDSDAMSAARKLGVEHILSGSVRRSSSTIRINAQLIDGDDGLERWSQTFDRPVGDVLQIQTGIATSVAQTLSIHLGSNDRAVLSLGGTNNPAAQNLLLQAANQQADSEAGLRKSLSLIDAALAIDSTYAEAHARKAGLLNNFATVYTQSVAERRQAQSQALSSANRAIAIEPRFPLGYATRAFIHREQLNMGRALADLVKAESLPGQDAGTLVTYAALLSQGERPEEAMRRIREAITLDPLNSAPHATEAFILYNARRFAGAAAAARRALRLAPGHANSLRHLANSLLWLDRTAEAEAEYSKLEATDYRRLLGQAVLAIRAGNRASALTNLDAMKRRYGDSAYYQYGQIHAQLGMADQAFADLQLALALRDPGMAGLRVDPFLDPIRRDPRFAPLEAKLNFPSI